MPDERTLPRVKVCGLRELEAAAGAITAGADAIGLVGDPRSSRHIDEQDAARLVAALDGAVACVGVLVDVTPSEAARWAQASGVTHLQLCGDERAEDWRDFELPLLRRLAVDARAEDELARWGHVALGFVLDHPSTAGGSGLAVDREIAAGLARQAPCLLAGGLDASSVAAAVASVRPAGVDSSSRLESAPGVKDPARVAAFVRAAREALAELGP